MDLDCTFLHITEVSAFLLTKRIRASEHAIKRWVSDGIRGHKLQVYKLGGKVYTNEAAIKEFFGKIA